MFPQMIPLSVKQSGDVSNNVLFMIKKKQNYVFQECNSCKMMINAAAEKIAIFNHKETRQFKLLRKLGRNEKTLSHLFYIIPKTEHKHARYFRWGKSGNLNLCS